MSQSWPGQMRTVYGDHQGLLMHTFHNLTENILLVMVVEEIKMVTTGLLEESMM